jgi:hypothetical protein
MLSHRLHFFAPFVPFLVLAFCAQQAVPATQAAKPWQVQRRQQKSKCKNTKTQRQQQQRT